MTGKGPDPADLEAQYNNRAAVPDHPAVMARWREKAEAARGRDPPARINYGLGERETMDWFSAGPEAPVAVFIHGGYWQALDPSWFSWIAPPLLSHGISVAIPAYDLCPQVRLGRIVRQMREATEFIQARTGRRPVVTGHSAGGHLAACMLSEGLASAAVAISGLFDLAPLVSTSLNVALGLDANAAAALSPIHWPVPNGATPGGTVLDCVVGADETPAFVGQSEAMVRLWGGRGASTRLERLEGLNHFTVLDPLADPESGLVRRIAALAHGSMTD